LAGFMGGAGGAVPEPHAPSNSETAPTTAAKVTRIRRDAVTAVRLSFAQMVVARRGLTLARLRPAAPLAVAEGASAKLRCGRLWA